MGSAVNKILAVNILTMTYSADINNFNDVFNKIYDSIIAYSYTPK